MKTLLWLDDVRSPFESQWVTLFSPIPSNELSHIEWVKSYQEFVKWIVENGLPDAICFDYDLGLDEVHEKKTMSKSALKRFRKTPEYKTGLDCVKWLVEYCLDKHLKLPKYNVQSTNDVGKKKINELLELCSRGQHV